MKMTTMQYWLLGFWWDFFCVWRLDDLEQHKCWYTDDDVVKDMENDADDDKEL